MLAAGGWKTEIGLKEFGGHSLALAQQASKNGSDLIIAYGGDGTLNQVVNGVEHNKKSRSVVGVIPGGTANLWAGDIGVPPGPVQAALALINSEVRKVDVGHVFVSDITFPDTFSGRKTATNSKKKSKTLTKGKTRDHFLLMAGLGFDATVMSSVSKPLKYRIGPLAVGLAAAKSLPEQRPFPLEITVEGGDDQEKNSWQGEALQVIIGNTRRYAMVLETTPNAYIDDGVLDLCIIISGDALTTMQQLGSLLLRRKPDNTVTETFRGSRFHIKVPASVPFQVDGSAVKLKDYLQKQDADTLRLLSDLDQVMVTYTVEVLPCGLEMMVPRTYDDELFLHASRAHQQQAEQEDPDRPRREEARGDEGPVETAQQEYTARLESQPELPTTDKEQEQEHPREELNEMPVEARVLLEQGRKVTVIGKTPNPAESGTYIVAGNAQKPITGDPVPVAVVLNKETILLNRHGEHLGEELVKLLHEGSIIVVDGKKSKRGVIHAKHMLML